MNLYYFLAQSVAVDLSIYPPPVLLLCVPTALHWTVTRSLIPRTDMGRVDWIKIYYTYRYMYYFLDEWDNEWILFSPLIYMAYARNSFIAFAHSNLSACLSHIDDCNRNILAIRCIIRMPMAHAMLSILAHTVVCSPIIKSQMVAALISFCFIYTRTINLTVVDLILLSIVPIFVFSFYWVVLHCRLYFHDSISSHVWFSVVGWTAQKSN